MLQIWMATVRARKSYVKFLKYIFLIIWYLKPVIEGAQ